MSKFNQSTKGTNITVNKSGNIAYKMSEKAKLVTMVLTTMFGEVKYYGDNSNELIKLAENADMAFLSKLTIYARREMNMRSVSHALTGVISKHGKAYIKQTVSGIVVRADDITEILSCYIAMYGKPIPNGLKKALATALCKLDEYALSKYKESSKSLSIRDVLRLVHPKPTNKEQEALFGRVIKDELQIPFTWETELSAKGNTKEVWENLIESNQVGYMALLRNLKNILNAEPNNIQKVFDKLENKEQVLKSRQLPFRFYSAYQRLSQEDKASSKVLDVLETAIEHSVENIEKIQGKTLIAIDVSGSMSSPVSQKSTIKCSDIACLFASLANKICDESIIVSFDTSLEKVAISTKGGIIQNAKSINVRGGCTDITLPLQFLLKKNITVDRMILFSDNEANQRTEITQKLADEYRKKINSDFWVHGIDLQGYGTQQFMGAKTNIIAGWSEKVLNFILVAENGIGNLVREIEDYYCFYN